jgi:type I restriction enzyme S subunit
MSWEIRSIGDVCTLEKGNIGITKAIDGEYPLVVLGEERKTHNKFQFDDEAVVIPLVSSTGHGHRSMKRIHYQSGKFSVGNILCAVIPKDKSKLSAQYLYRYLDLNKEKELVSRMKGMANVSLPMKSIAEVEIPIPPIEVQYDIVSIFEALEETNYTLQDEQSHQLDLLKKLRQQILQDAVQGKLVPQDPNDEPASKLQKRIKEEKEKLVREKKIKKEKPLPPIKPEEIPFEIPENWFFYRLGEIVHITGGKRVPNGYQLLKSPTNHGYIRITDMKNGTILENDLRYISNEVYEGIKNYIIQKEDLYITIAGTIGQVGEVPDYFDGMNLTENAARIKLYLINKTFIKFCLNSKYCQTQFIDRTKAMAQPKLALKRIETTLIALPPINEQYRISKKIEQLMTLCDKLEQNIHQNQKYTLELLQMALKEALEPKN